MPEYKKKKRPKFGNKPKVKQRPSADEQDIEMSEEEKPQKQKMRVVKGKKANNKKRLIILAFVAVAVFLFVFIFKIVYPAGVMEGLSNGFALIGSGDYPIEISGSRTVDVKMRDSYYFVLTNKQVKAFSNSGKELFSHTHGYENPMIKIAQSRAMVFEQGGKELCIFTLSGLVSTIETENSIITAAMSDSGTYAVVTKSEDYASDVSVYTKDDKRIYRWYSAEDVVNNVAVCYDGNQIAVSTFNADTGKIMSKVRILQYDSPKAIYTKEIDDGVVYALDSTFRNYFAIALQSGICVVDWSGEEEHTYKNEYALSMLRTGDEFVAVFNRESDKTDNKIAVISYDGTVESEIGFKGIISDIAVKGEYIYCVSDSKVYILNFKGKIIRETKCSFGSVRAVISDSSTAIIISDSKIEKIELERE